MGREIVVEASGRTLAAELSDSAAAQRVLSSLPLEVRMSRWGDEYYGSIGIEIPEDATARVIMDVGEIAYWPPGTALCIFFGPTPASTDGRPRAASPVVPIGRVIAGLDGLAPLGSSVTMRFVVA